MFCLKDYYYYIYSIMNIYKFIFIFSFIKLIKEINQQYKSYPILIIKKNVLLITCKEDNYINLINF